MTGQNSNSAKITCGCKDYKHLELKRSDIEERSKQTEEIEGLLEKLIQNKYKDALYKCKGCGQYWQVGYDWVGGGDKYYFKVPTIDTQDWLKKPYVQPDKLIMSATSINKFTKLNSFSLKDEKCKEKSCKYKAINYSVFCIVHHILSLTKNEDIEQTRIFKPYSIKNLYKHPKLRHLLEVFQAIIIT